MLITKLAILISLILLTSCANNPSSSIVSSNVSCTSEQNTVTDYTGVGIVHTNNVTARLKDSAGKIISPSESKKQTTSNGIEFTALFYYENAVSRGSYSVEIVANNLVIETYELSVRTNNSPVLTVFCT
ncbi:MAG: hypothetical protein R3E39_28255 [Anaerolineae bacterium]